MLCQQFIVSGRKRYVTISSNWSFASISFVICLFVGMTFGADLCKDVPQSKYRTVPNIIFVCTQEIERQLHRNSGKHCATVIYFVM